MPVPLRRIFRTAVPALLVSEGPVGRFTHRVLPRYVDQNLHMNYASYLEVAELARWDWGIRSGMFREWIRVRGRPVVGSVEVRYLRELRPLQRFTIESRLVGFDRRALRLEQHFVCGGAVHAEMGLNALLVGREGPLPRQTLEDVMAPWVVPPRAETVAV